MKITIKFALAALLLAALAACHPEDVDLPGKDAVTISRIQAGIAEMAEAPSTRSFTQDAETGYTGAVKTGFVEGDVIHLIVFNGNSPQRYSTATLNAQGNWNISPTLFLNSGEKITAFYNGVKDAYADASTALGGAYIEAAKADPSDALIADGNNSGHGGQYGGSVTITGGTLAITFAHQHALIRISSIDNRLGTGYDVIKVIANVKSASQNGSTISLIHDGSESNGNGEWQCIANGYYTASAEYSLKSFTLTLGSSSDTKATTASLTIPLSDNGYGKDLAYGRSYTYRLLLLPGSATAILDDGTQGPAWDDAHRDPTVPAGYIPLYTVEDLQKIGVNTSSGTPGSPAYSPATVNGYTYKEANADGTGEGTTPLTFSLAANYILMADIDLAATPAAASNATPDAANWTPIGSTSAFTGRFNGNGHTIKGMKVNTGNAYAGFFCSLSGATIYNLHFRGATGNDAQTSYAGTLAGQAINSNIALCSATNCTVSGKDYVGGLIGYTNNAHLTRCHTTNCTVTSTYYSGGLTGDNDRASILAASILAACYSTDCTATATATATNAYAGGLSGYNNGATLYGCYATGAKATATGNNGGYAGALAGYLSSDNSSNYNYACTVISCYARTGTGSTSSPGVTATAATAITVEATQLIGKIDESGSPHSTILACISPLQEDGSGSGGSSDPTGTYGITYWGADAGYSPLTDATALTESGSGGSGGSGSVSHASLPGVRTVCVNTTGKSITQSAIPNSSGSSNIVPAATIPPGGIYVEARTWSATGIWGSIPNGTPGNQVPPHIRWNYEGSSNNP